MPEICCRHVDAVTGRRDLADQGREPAEVSSLDSQFNGDNITDRVHTQQFTVDVGECAGEASQRLRNLLTAEGQRARHVVERSVLGEQGAETMSVEDVPFRQAVCLTNNLFVAIHFCSSLMLGVAKRNEVLPLGSRQRAGGVSAMGKLFEVCQLAAVGQIAGADTHGSCHLASQHDLGYGLPRP